MTTDVFQHHDPVTFLNDWLQAVQSQNSAFSLRAWAKQLGLSHVAMLSMVLARKRRLLTSLSSRIGQQMLRAGHFDEIQSRYFDMLVLFANARNEDEKLFYQRILASLRPDQNFSTLELDRLRLISEWFHVAILEMTYLKKFSSDPEWIHRRLGGSVNLSQVKEAIDRLVRLGLLERSATGQLTKTSQHLSMPTDRPDQGLRTFNAGMIRRALEALETQSVTERDITGYTMAIDRAKIPEAKAMIRDFRRNLAKFLESPAGDSVYQLNIQLFDVIPENGGSRV